VYSGGGVYNRNRPGERQQEKGTDMRFVEGVKKAKGIEERGERWREYGRGSSKQSGDRFRLSNLAVSNPSRPYVNRSSKRSEEGPGPLGCDTAELGVKWEYQLKQKQEAVLRLDLTIKSKNSSDTQLKDY